MSEMIFDLGGFKIIEVRYKDKSGFEEMEPVIGGELGFKNKDGFNTDVVPEDDTLPVLVEMNLSIETKDFSFSIILDMLLDIKNSGQSFKDAIENEEIVEGVKSGLYRKVTQIVANLTADSKALPVFMRLE